MHDLLLVQSLKPKDDLVEYVPDVFLLHEFPILLQLGDLRLEVTSIRVFHDDTERLGTFFEKGILVGNNIRVLDRGKDSYFIQSVLFFFG